MSISLRQYIDITSSVGASAAVSTRDLIGRLFTDNPLLPTGSFVEFDDEDEVGSYFGTTSQEYFRAEFYFGWTSKIGTRAQKISYARWVDVDTAPLIYGAPGTQSIATWNAITAGAFGLTIAGTVNTFTGMNFSGAANLAAVAGIIQTAIRAKTGAMWTAATVSYDPVRGSFQFVGGVTGVALISVQAGAGGADIAAQLGWLSPNTILSNGAVTMSISSTLAQSSNASNNFGTYLFMPTLSTAQITESAVWNNGNNVEFMYTIPVTVSNVSAVQAAVAGVGGCTITLSPLTSEYPEMVPMMILAATDYTQRNAVQNYMFNIFDLTPSVTDDTTKDTYDAINVNYYGQTQSAGNQIQFYQNGVMQGLPVDPSDQNVYANEMWFKDFVAADLMTALLVLPQIPASNAGVVIIRGILQGDIDAALNNGVFEAGKTLTTDQKYYITTITGDTDAWRSVQTYGYIVDVEIVPVTVNNILKYEADYTIVYGKDDVIRKINGRHILI